MRDANLPKNSDEITLPDLEHRILVNGVNGHPYPAREYIHRNIIREGPANVNGKLNRLEYDGRLKESPVRKLILHWIHQGLYVTGVHGTNPEDNYDEGLVDKNELRQFLLEKEYAIPDGLGKRENEPACKPSENIAHSSKDNTEQLDPRKETTHLQLIRALLAEAGIDVSKNYPAARSIQDKAVRNGLQVPESEETIVKVLKAIESQLG